MRLLDMEVIESEFIRMRQRELRMTNLLGLIHVLTSLLSDLIGVKPACRRVARTIVEESGFADCMIFLRNPESDTMVPVEAVSMADLLEDGKPFSDSVSDWPSFDPAVFRDALARNECLVVDTPATGEFSNGGPVKAPALGSTLVVPLLDLGVMVLAGSKQCGFSPQETRDWTMLGSIVAQIIQTEMLHERLSMDNQGLRLEIDSKNRELERRYGELASVNRFLEQIIDQCPEGMCILDSGGMIAQMNRGMKALRGKSPGDLLGRSPAVVFQDPAQFLKLSEQVARGQSGTLSEAFLMDSEGNPRPMEVFLTRLDRESERPDAFLLVLYDQTEKKAMREHLIRTEKLAALGTMAGGVAHDFNNLLMTMLGNTQLLLLQTRDEKTRQRLESIEMAVQDAAHSLRRLNAFTVEPRKEGASRINVVDVDEVIRDAIELTRPRWKNIIERLGHTIEFRHETSGACRAAMHASDLREVLTNLIFNAVDAMPEGGVLTLRSAESRGRVHIDVMDSGVGIPEETVQRIFDPFFTTKGVGNSGLGLSVCWNLVVRYGGTMEVKSVPGRGSCFRIVLPGGEVREETAAPRQVAPCAAGCRVLLVDDDEDVLRILRDMIRLSGHKVIATHSPEEALSLLDTEPFDLVLTDLGMPKVTGWEVARKARDRNPGVPVVVVTGWGAQCQEDEFLSNGVDMVLSKPVNYEKLQEVMRRFLAGRSDVQ